MSINDTTDAMRSNRKYNEVGRYAIQKKSNARENN